MSSRLRFRHRAFFYCVLLVSVVLTLSLLAQVQDTSGSMATDSSSPSTISGHVVNAITGLPVSRALVRLDDRAVLTGHDGNFEFDQVTNAAGSLQVIKPGFYSSIDPGGASGMFLHTNQVTGPLELRLYPEALLTGTVAEADGEPLPHIIVSARRSVFDESGHRWIPMAQAQTDGHGRFRLPVPPGDYKLESMYAPRLSGADEAIMPVVVPAETSSETSSLIKIHSGEELSFDLKPLTSRSYRVTATFDSGIGRGFPRVSARSSNGATISLPINFSHAGASNGARLELPRGTYTLTADIMSPEGAEQAETRVTITDHDVSGVVFHLTPVPELPVELVVDGATTSDNSQPSLQQLGLMLENIESDSDVFNSTIRLATQADHTVRFTAPSGSYRLRAISNGSWYVKAANYGTSDLLQQDLVIGPGAGGTPIRITVSNQTANLQGTCKQGDLPIACNVYLVPTFPSAKSVFIMQGNAQGLYSNASLPPGTYQAIAFEQRHSADYSDPATLAPFAAHVRIVTVNAGEKPTLDLDVVSAAEITP